MKVSDYFGRYFVELVLYSGQRIQSELIESRAHALAERDSLVRAAMVEDAYVIDTKTGEIVPRTRGGIAIVHNPAATWRTT
ncbi:MAG TPA: hypothetical protein VFD36_29450 [Kofleriaceae bacterium]|nr:hypothetical protein [Kofleriaceae bacterium]